MKITYDWNISIHPIFDLFGINIPIFIRYDEICELTIVKNSFKI